MRAGEEVNRKYDTIIIGGGVIGNSISYHLSERKQEEILLIDKGFPLSGTSGSTQAWVWVHDKSPSWYAEFSMYSAELYRFLSRKIGDFEYERTGGLSPFFREKERIAAEKMAEEYAAFGINIKVLNREEVLQKEPAFTPEVLGATYSDIDGNLNPFRLVELYMKASKKNGVHHSFYNQVFDIRKEVDTYHVYTKDGVFTCENLILAAGPWTGELGNLLNVHIPVKQVRGQILVTEPLEPLLKYTISGMRQANNGEVLIGYSMEHEGFDRKSTLDVMQDTATLAVKYVPDLANAKVVRCFSGIRVIPEDGFPIIGEVPALENLYVAVMHSGMTLSPLVGTLMAELIYDGETSVPLDLYSLERFSR